MLEAIDFRDLCVFQNRCFSILELCAFFRKNLAADLGRPVEAGSQEGLNRVSALPEGRKCSNNMSS